MTNSLTATAIEICSMADADSLYDMSSDQEQDLSAADAEEDEVSEQGYITNVTAELPNINHLSKICWLQPENLVDPTPKIFKKKFPSEIIYCSSGLK